MGGYAAFAGAGAVDLNGASYLLRPWDRAHQTLLEKQYCPEQGDRRKNFKYHHQERLNLFQDGNCCCTTLLHSVFNNILILFRKLFIFEFDISKVLLSSNSVLQRPVYMT